MKNIITEEMRFRQKLCEYARKNRVTKAARKYQTNRQFVYRQLKKYDGNVRSLALKSRKPKNYPYSPWQNGKVERSHREDSKILYSQKIFRSEKELIEEVKRHEKRYNKTAKISLNFKSPNEVVKENKGKFLIS